MGKTSAAAPTLAKPAATLRSATEDGSEGEGRLARAASSITSAIWETDLAAAPKWRAWPIRAAQIFYAVARGLADGQLSLRAMSLVYTTLLSLVPLLALSFSVLKGFGVHNEIEPRLLDLLAPLGEKGVEIAERIIEFVENVKAGVLGSMGLALLIYTVISLMQKIERTFNYIWYVTRARTFAQRFSEYISVILIGPVLVFSSMGIMATVMSLSAVESLSAIQPVGVLIEFAGRLIPYMMIVAAFTFFFAFIPNTRVRLRSAFVGALVAGLLWQALGWTFASFIVNATKYTAIYAGFATLIIFMMWLYLSWLILLVGASIAFYHQRPEYVTATHETLKLSNRVKEKIALMVAFLIGKHYYGNHAPWTIEGLSQTLRVPAEATEAVMAALEKNGLVTRTAGETPAYVPRRPPESIRVKDILDAVRSADEKAHANLGRMPAVATVDRLAERLDEAVAQALRGQTMKDLALSEAPEVTAVPDAAVPDAPVPDAAVPDAAAAGDEASSDLRRKA